MKGIILAALAAVFFATPAMAAHHPAERGYGFIDVAAIAPYPIELKPAHAVRHHKAQASRQVHKAVKTTRKDQSRAPQEPRAKSNLDDLANYQDGIAGPEPIVITEDRPHRLDGVVRIADAQFRFASGGYGPSIPYGDYEISRDSEGSWGRRHGALDLTGVDRGDIWDPKLKRHREGIELHGGALATLGCVAIEQWSRARSMIRAMIDHFDHAFLHVWPGSVSITPLRSSGQVMIALQENSTRQARADRAVHRARYARHRRYRHYARG